MNKAIWLLPIVITTVFSVYLFENISISDNVDASTQAFIRGHMVIIASDTDGNIYSYEQSDNKIVTRAENCVAKMVFGFDGGATVGNTACIGLIDSGYQFIALGVTGGPSSAFVDGDLDLRSPATQAGLINPIRGTVTYTNSTDASFSSTLISAQFTNTGATETVNEAGLFNSTTVSTNGMFAGNNFANVTLNNGDDITINWTVEIGEATVP